MDKHPQPSNGGVPSLLTADDVARYLQVSRATVYRLVDARRVPFHRLHGVLRFSANDLEAWLKEQRVPSMLEYERKKNP